MTDIQRIKSDPPQMPQPLCPRCGSLMSLTRIEPDRPGMDCRTFECAQCQHIETILVAFA